MTICRHPSEERLYVLFELRRLQAKANVIVKNLFALIFSKLFDPNDYLQLIKHRQR